MSASIDQEFLKQCIRDVPNFPKPGIVFRDITPLLANPKAFRGMAEALGEHITKHRADALVAIESRGFIFASAVAIHLGLPMKLVRKPGKLPYEKVWQEYQLEYGMDRVEMHTDAVRTGRRYAVVDDVIATGGTAAATVDLIRRQGGDIAVCAFAIELTALAGRKRLAPFAVESVLAY